MNWLHVTWPMGFALAALAAPIVLFYFLKLRRPRVEVPSLALWRQVINDRRVNSPFQRFKRNLLLLLQLLLLLCLTVAATQPFVGGGAEDADFLPILIDQSASMAATDAAGGRSRLDAAKDEIRDIVENLRPGQRVSLVAVGSAARRLTDFTDNKRVLRAALDKVEPLAVESRLEEGLRVTQALARTVRVKTVFLFTDGNVPTDVSFELPFTLNYRRLPAGGPNLGIVAMNARRAGPETWEVFARVEASQTVGESPATAKLELRRGKELLATERVSLDRGGSESFSVRLDADAKTTVTATLRPDGFDALAADDTAALDLPTPRPLAVYCPPELDTYRQALAANENLVLFPTEGRDEPASFDLLVSDRPADLDKEATAALFVGVIPEELKPLVSIKDGLSEPIDWRRSDPLLNHVQLAEIQAGEQPTSAAGVTSEDYEARGYEVVAFGQAGPLMLRKSTPGRTAYYILFHTDRSTLPYRIGFPILVSNLIQEALRGADLLEVRAGRTGVLEPIAAEPGADYAVTGPDGTTITVRGGDGGQLAGVPAPAVGNYVVRRGGRIVATTHASLLSSSETSLASAERLRFKEVDVATADALPTETPLWPYFAWAGFGFLLAEWWLFQRRPGGTRK